MTEYRVIPREEIPYVYRGGWYIRPLPCTEIYLHHPALAGEPGPDATYEEDLAYVLLLERIGYQRFGPHQGILWSPDGDPMQYGAGISYSYIVMKSGRIFEGHITERESSHTAGHNKTAVGICWAGNFVGTAEPHENQIDATAWLIMELKRTGVTTTIDFTGGHRDVYATSCPGNAYDDIARVDALTTGEGTVVTNTRTPADVATWEAILRAEGYDIYDGPSAVRAGKCYPGAPGHGHLADSTHFVDRYGNPKGTPRVGGAVDVGKDPNSSTPISMWEKVRLDDLATRLVKAGFRVIWGVAAHFDHLHFDYNVAGGHQLNYQGPNYPFTVPEILWVQQSLAKIPKKGSTAVYYTGEHDAIRGVNTLGAIKTFQADRGLTADGNPGPMTKAALSAALADLDRLFGFTADHWKRVQTILVRTGDLLDPDGDAVDGDPGKLTLDALKVFQARHKLTPDGLPGVNTMTALEREYALLVAPKPAPAPTPAPEPTLSERLAKFRLAGRNAHASEVAAYEAKIPEGTGVILYKRDTQDMAPAMQLAFRSGGDTVAFSVRADGTMPGEILQEIADIQPDWVVAVGMPVLDVTLASALDAAKITY